MARGARPVDIDRAEDMRVDGRVIGCMGGIDTCLEYHVTFTFHHESVCVSACCDIPASINYALHCVG